jgi:aminopeptidase N
VNSGAAPLSSFLGLASAMGSNRDARAWQQIARALAVIEYAERGSPGYTAFTAYARALIKPVAESLGWDAAREETPDVNDLRDTVLRDLSRWGDESTIDSARRRFAAFLQEPAKVGADAQTTLLAIVGQNADAVAFQQLHELAKTTADETAKERYYLALARVRDPALARQVLQIALSDELPPQANTLPRRMIFAVSREHPQLSWEAYRDHLDQLMKSIASVEQSVRIAEQTPAVYWDAVPLDELESWVRSKIPSEAADNLARAMESARFLSAQKRSLVKSADAYLATVSPASR